MLEKLLSYTQVYRDKRMLIMLAFGFASGFPFPLVFNTLSLWLKEVGLGLTLIGLFSLAKIPYSLKWLWAPLTDQLQIPGLSRLGRRRSWALLTQIFVAVLIIIIALANPAQIPYLFFALVFLLAISSASQDIVLDAYRVESFSTSEQGAASAVFVTGYRLGFIFSGAGALFLASIMDWPQVYLIMSSGSLVGIVTIILIKEPVTATIHKQLHNFREFMAQSVIAPFKDFIQRPHWQLILLFIFLYRMSDAYVSPMTYMFYTDIGFNYVQIASIIKILGSVAIIGGMFLGGILLSRISLNQGLVICGILQALSNLTYVVQAHVGDNQYMLMVTIFVENITGGMGTAAFVAYISSLCNLNYTATQYALLSSLMSLARDGLAATSGSLAGWLGWSNFFILSTFLAIPGMVVLGLLIWFQHQEKRNHLPSPA